MKPITLLQICLASLPCLVDWRKHLNGRHQVEFGQRTDLDPGDASLLRITVKNLDQRWLERRRPGCGRTDLSDWWLRLEVADQNIGAVRSRRFQRRTRNLDSFVDAGDIGVRKPRAEFVTDLRDQGVMKVGPSRLRLHVGIHSRKRSRHARPPTPLAPDPFRHGLPHTTDLHALRPPL